MRQFYMKYILLNAILFLFATISNAQNLTVKSISFLPNDQTAIEHPCFTIDGDTCYLLKIKTDNVEGIEFPNANQYIKASYLAGTYNVYLPTLSRRLDLSHKDYLPARIDMTEYGYKTPRKGKTYLVVLDVPKKVDLESSVTIKVEPKQAKVIFDGQAYETNQNGILELPYPTGTYRYEVSFPNYHPKKGTVSIGKSEAKTITVRLQPITHEVLVKSNVKSAHVFVDNIDYGKVGKLQLPQGTHAIRLQADGYVDDGKNVEINASTSTLTFSMTKNERTTHIHATPVTIYSTANHVYKNNKEIKGWYTGKPVLFMPGKYLITDDNRKKQKIIVTSQPMTVTL